MSVLEGHRRENRVIGWPVTFEGGTYIRSRSRVYISRKRGSEVIPPGIKVIESTKRTYYTDRNIERVSYEVENWGNE